MQFGRSCSHALFIVFASAILSGCGGGGGSSAASPPPPVQPPPAQPPPAQPPPAGPDTSYQPGVFLASEEFAAACEAPRSGMDPATGQAYPDYQGSVLTENHWLRSWSHETYLWYDEIIDRNPAGFSDPLAYFDLLKTTAVTQNGLPRDRFHYTQETQEWQKLSQSGLMLGYGMRLVLLNPAPPRLLVVNYVNANSPADGIARGTRILEVDGIDVVNTNNDADLAYLSSALSPTVEGETHHFRFQTAGGAVFQRTMAAENVIISPVPLTNTFSTISGDTGYLLFTDHIATAESALRNAFSDLLNAPAGPVNNLILDLRFNGGGYLAIASQLAYMIAGPLRTNGKIFEQQKFNNQHQGFNPVTGEALVPWPFLNQTIGLSEPPGQALPSLNLDRVFILTSPQTCSASESVINSLRGVGVEVILIGYTTCGKPYGFYPTDNCGTTYFTIQFRGENHLGFGDYVDGFSPQNLQGSVGEPVAGCAVIDNLTVSAGNPGDPLTQSAIQYINTSVCPAPPPSSSMLIQPQSLSGLHSPQHSLTLPQPFSLTNRILGFPR